jgi:MFS family permease
MAEPHDPYAALRVADFRRLLACGLLASIASEIQAVAVGWELYLRTNDAKALGLVGLVQFLPVLLLSLPAGHAADRYSRKWLVAGALALTTSASLGLAAISYVQAPVWLIYVCIGLVGVGQAFSGPARWSLVPSIVPEELLTSAVTWTSSSWQIAAVVGPAVGGLGLAAASKYIGPAVTRLGWSFVGEGADGAVDHAIYFVYTLGAVFSAISITLLLPIRPRPNQHPREEVTLRSLLAGLRFVFQTELILATITLDLFAVLLGGATALLPVFAKDILHVGPTWFGWLRAAPSIGALLMALVLAHRPPLRRAGPALLWSVAGFGAAMVVFGLSRNPYLSFAMLAITGALDNISIVVRGTLVQVLTPDSMRGRVAAVNVIFIGSSNELGAFESGLTAGWFGPVLSVVGGGIGSILVVLIVMAHWPKLLRLGSLASLAADQAVVPPLAGSAEAFEAAEASMAIQPAKPTEVRPPP